MLESEFYFYIKNQAQLSERHEGKVLVIQGKEVVGVYDSEGEALRKTVADHKLKLGSFLIQTCSSDPNSVVNTFHSRVKI